MNALEALLQAVKEDKGAGSSQAVKRDHLVRALEILSAQAEKK